MKNTLRRNLDTRFFKDDNYDDMTTNMIKWSDNQLVVYPTGMIMYNQCNRCKLGIHDIIIILAMMCLPVFYAIWL